MNIDRLSIPPFLFSLVLFSLTACSMQLSAPTVSHDPVVDAQPWRIHCETALSMQESAEITGTENERWIRGRDSAGAPIELHGALVDGFFEVARVSTTTGETVPLARTALRKVCIDTIAAREEDEPLLLGWVMAAREHEDIEVPIVYPRDDSQGRISRVVIFGDSLTDSGRLKRRLLVFPEKPYWLGRFSNGPVWPEYLAMATDVAVQNNAFGGASVVYLEQLPGAGIVTHIREYGQMFVSGTIDLQIKDYVEKSLDGAGITRPDETLFIIWGGANDYITKEPVFGLITTFLNSPEGESGYRAVARETVAGLDGLVRTLYLAGGRNFLLLNLPDLGQTPIVLQNTTYTPDLSDKLDEDGRRMELARRLSELSRYHNSLLAEAVEQLQRDLENSEVHLLDAYTEFAGLARPGATPSSPDHGYDYAAHTQILSHGDRQLELQRPCYSGSYMGSRDPEEFCSDAGTAVFWDVVHPTTLTHCWQAYSVGGALRRAGWLSELPPEPVYLEWCRAIVDEVTFGHESHYILD